MTRRPRNGSDTAGTRSSRPGGPLPPAPEPESESAEGEGAVDEVPPSPVFLEFETPLAGWYSGGRFDVIVRGVVLSGAPALSVAFRDAFGNDLASVQFGHNEQMEPAELPDGESGYRAGFQVYLPMRGGQGIRIADLRVRADARDGGSFECSIRIGCMNADAAIIAGPAREMEEAEIPPPSGMVYLEEASLGPDGLLRTSGWTLARSPIVAVQIFAGDQRAGAALHGRDRGDVAEVYPEYPNAHRAGFVLERLDAAAFADVAAVTVQVLCLSGACFAATVPLSREVHVSAEPPALPAAPEPEAPEPEPEPEPPVASAQAVALGRAIVIICDRAIAAGPDLLLVEGWAASGAGIARITIEVDGIPHGDAVYGHDRPDVAAEHAGLPVGTGYRFEKQIPGLSGGPHEVRVIAISNAGDEKDIAIQVTDPDLPAFRFELDIPATRDGIAIDPVTGRMTIEGWALARGGMDRIEVALDGNPLGQVHYGVVRPDVGAAFPGWDGAVRSGYTFHCPSRALPDGDHVVQLTARSKTGETHVHAFQITVRKTDDPEETVSIRRRVSHVEQRMRADILRQLNWQPVFQVIVTGDPAAGGNAWSLTLTSLLEQSWTFWRAVILTDDAVEAAELGRLLAALPAADASRFTILPASALDGTDLSGGADLTAFLAIGDELGHDALSAFAIASGLHPHADCLYADEFRMPPVGPRPEAFFKPDFSPTLLLSANYIGRPLVVRSGLLAAAGVTVETVVRGGFHDLALRCTEAARSVHHIAELLCRTDGATLANAEDSADALTRAMARRGIPASIEPGRVPRTWHVRRTVPVTGKVSIIMPTCAAKGHIGTCLRTLREKTSYKNFEIVVIDNIPDSEPDWKRFVQENADKIVDMPPPFNWSRFNNRAVDVSDGEYLLFLNDDMEVIQDDWLETLLEDAARPEVGIAGARLLYSNRTVQHGGMFLGAGIGRHAFRYAEEDEPGYFGLALTKREVIAVTGACLLVRREVFERLGRFDEAHDVVNNDLDFCLRAHRAGLLTIYSPHATLIHHELASRENMKDDFDTARFTGEWRTLFAGGDPYFNPHLSRHADDFQIDDEAIRMQFSGHPLLNRDEVKNILVVKLDHIGDFVTALPAIRRLKSYFPAARLTVLAAPASTAFAAVEPAIDEFIPFEFFHARSQLGEKELTADDLDALTETLAPYRFDIAVDLRKHLSTRHILKCSGARMLAGYDSVDRFPWLHVALEWEGDKALQHKRNHITDDLLHLVAAVDAACASDRRLFDPRPPAMTVDELPAHARHIFDRPVAIVHPGAGNITKQWPEAHVAALIDLLIERSGVSVLMVGGKDEAETATAIMDAVARPDRVASVAGDLPLRDLPRLLAMGALFIGNDSGPKHIAAGMGVPTIGVHSGVIDPGEWAPMGERTVAMHRNMSCSPCYLSRADDCPRGLACIKMLEPAHVHRMAEMFLARTVAATA